SLAANTALAVTRRVVTQRGTSHRLCAPRRSCARRFRCATCKPSSDFQRANWAVGDGRPGPGPRIRLEDLMHWWDTANLDRLRLARSARRYAEQGWPVVPGAYLVARRAGRHSAVRRFDCGEPGCQTVACHPAIPRWEAAASTNLDVVDSWW